MDKNLRNKYLSKPRYHRYLIAVGNDHGRAIALYNANILLSQAFHPLITQFEVIFRNSVDTIMAQHFKDRNWIINQKTGFMNDRSLKKSNYYLRKCVNNVEAKLIKAKVPVSSEKIISDQTLGFWIAFLASPHYRLVNGQTIHVFANKPSTENRTGIYTRLEMIKKFRNRVNHCEPVCFNGNHIDCSKALLVRTSLYELVEWIEPGLVPFFRNIDVIDHQINQMLRI
ncbi:Abi family protein [Dyadobacter sp. CY351]|uniref:Abi family protein n=1 Tax=Dyadobacter sp. CY351 TaxID=2909337 RepID=UPI001F244133|nr:Abi family protein [Dyadobacter sp. CY351]